ncbi:9842_t:CDS:1 [Dentiscutata erythropus]|uniref:9842_t:CDS:1 n=1 Tax=Dentiscutata erythropus TaxID=1348616 RepID=A0A9N9EIZ1_9GLOM|nr:9842_t:CDS:1 [Dentiscutata erythropus]
MQNSKKKNYYNIAREDLEKLNSDIFVEEDIKLSQTQKKIKFIFRKLKRARKLNRIHTLVYAFYLGEILEKAPGKKKFNDEDLSRYYAEVSVRVYYLFQKSGVNRIYQMTKLTLATISKLTAGEFQQLVNDNSDSNDDSEDESSPEDNNNITNELSQNIDTENGSFQNTGLSQITTNFPQDTTHQSILITVDRHNDSYQLSFNPNLNYQPLQNYPGFSGAHATIGSQLQNALEFSNIVYHQIPNLTDVSQAYASVGQPTQIANNSNTFRNTTVPHNSQRFRGSTY